MVNSRSTRPLDQSASIRKLRKGSLTDALVVTTTTAFSPSSSLRTANRSSVRWRGRDSPARVNASRDARLTSRSSISPGRADMTSISALSGWFRKDLTSISPRPKARLLVGKNTADINANMSPRLRTFSLPAPRPNSYIKCRNSMHL